LFTAIFKVLPDAKIRWKNVWIGGIFTAVLFMIGKLLFTVYIANSNPGEAFGAAGSFAIILLWMYYTSLILLLGAEFTQVWTRHTGKEIEPEKGNVKFKKQIVGENDQQ
jgi:membrane protein